MKKGENHIADIELILADYFTGSITEENLVKLNDWINANDENRVHFNSLKDAWMITGTKNAFSASHSEESWNKIKDKLSNTGSVEDRPLMNR